LEENKWHKSYDKGLDNYFFNITPKGKATRGKNRLIGLHENLKKLCIKRNYQE
jgi:hypothetical protein